MTPDQLESVRTARLQLLDLGDQKTAATLDWAAAHRPPMPSIDDCIVKETGHEIRALNDAIQQSIGGTRIGWDFAKGMEPAGPPSAPEPVATFRRIAEYAENLESAGEDATAVRGLLLALNAESSAASAPDPVALTDEQVDALIRESACSVNDRGRGLVTTEQLRGLVRSAALAASQPAPVEARPLFDRFGILLDDLATFLDEEAADQKGRGNDSTAAGREAQAFALREFIRVLVAAPVEAQAVPKGSMLVPVESLGYMREALRFAMTLCDAVPTRVHEGQHKEHPLHWFGQQVNIGANGGYRLVSTALSMAEVACRLAPGAAECSSSAAMGEADA